MQPRDGEAGLDPLEVGGRRKLSVHLTSQGRSLRRDGKDVVAQLLRHRQVVVPVRG